MSSLACSEEISTAVRDVTLMPELAIRFSTGLILKQFVQVPVVNKVMPTSAGRASSLASTSLDSKTGNRLAIWMVFPSTTRSISAASGRESCRSRCMFLILGPRGANSPRPFEGDSVCCLAPVKLSFRSVLALKQQEHLLQTTPHLVHCLLP